MGAISTQFVQHVARKSATCVCLYVFDKKLLVWLNCFLQLNTTTAVVSTNIVDIIGAVSGP